MKIECVSGGGAAWAAGAVPGVALPAWRGRAELRALHGIAASAAIEAAALAAHAPGALMAAAGLGVARWLLALAPHAQRIWVACGSGHNGGDGLFAAQHLARLGRQVQVWLPPKVLAADSALAARPALLGQALEGATAAGARITNELPSPDSFDVAVDALLGFRSQRAPDADIGAAIRSLMRAAPLRLAVDVPSGLCADSGRALGEDWVQADATLSLLTLKPGLFTAQGRDACGSVWHCDLGCAAALQAQTPNAWLGSSDALLQRRRWHAQHKGSFGDVAVVGGAAGMAGAAVLAARAALASACGRVFLSLLDESAPVWDSAEPGLMLRGPWWQTPRHPLAQGTVLVGCGGGEAVVAHLPALLHGAARLVLDADALNAVAAEPALARALQQRAKRQLPSVLTPHPLEAARLLACDTAQVQAQRLAAAQELAERFACAVVLKGSGTVIAAPAAVPMLNASGNPLLATAGTGDVLAGWLAGQWAQQPKLPPQALAAAAVWQHGAAADAAAACGQLRLRASALVQALTHLR